MLPAESYEIHYHTPGTRFPGCGYIDTCVIRDSKFVLRIRLY